MVRNASSVPPQSWATVGNFRYFVLDDRWEWSDEVARMHGYRPGTITPTTDLVLAHTHPDDTATVGDLILQVYRQGTAVTSRNRIVDARGNERLVIVVADRFFNTDGTPAGIAGFYIDITDQFEKDVQKRLTDEVMTISARRAVTNQAIGMVMLRYGVDGETAFSLLTAMSQQSNVKLRIVAERIVADPASLGATPLALDNPPGRLAPARRGNPDSCVSFKVPSNTRK
jgi:PAS domain S-box-containing protein